MKNLESWGRFPKAKHQHVETLSWISEAKSTLVETKTGQGPVLPRGLGRSYGDSCLLENGTLLLVTGCDKIIQFDPSRGILTAEAGVTLEQILDLIVPRGWFLPVSPGTKFVTLGGAIANDIHGKNHHAAGNFGNHVHSFELLRSDGTLIRCAEDSPPGSREAGFFRATIGGLGLTGLILWATVRLKKIKNPYIDQTVTKFRGVEEFVELSKKSESTHEYTVSWVDSLSSGNNLKGHFMAGNHCNLDLPPKNLGSGKSILAVPFDLPGFTLNPLTVRAFNFLYYRKQWAPKKQSLIHYHPFFYPLDSILHWNRIYGSHGFLQYQFVVPYEHDGGRAANQIMERIARSGQGSFLAVFKIFGTVPPRGMLSFPRPGMTLALDFKNTGPDLFRLLDELDERVIAAGGAIYPAKDARMSRQTFLASFPNVVEFKEYLDPGFQSDFSKRIGLTS